MQLENLFGVVVGDVFDRHATGGGVNEARSSSGTVQGQRKIHLLHDVDLFNQIDSVARETLVATLCCHQVLADHLFGHLLSVGGVVDQMYTTLKAGLFEVAETATSSEDLGFDYVAG